MKPTRIEISAKTIIFTVAFLLLLWVLFQIRSILVMVFVSFILATAVQPLIKRAGKYKIPALPVMLVIYICIISLFSVVIASLLPAVVEQSRALIENTPNYLHHLEAFLNIKFDPNMGTSYFSQVPSNLLKIAVGAFSNIINILAIFFISYHLTVERPHLHLYLTHFFTNSNSEKRAEALFLDIEKRVGGWVRGQLILMLIVGLMTYFGIILLGIPYALPLAVLAGIFEAVPNIGPIVAAIPAIILGFTISPLVGFGAVAISTLIQQLESILIVPKVMHSATGTKPLATILVLMIGYTLGGIAGAVLSMPFYLIAITIYAHVTK